MGVQLPRYYGISYWFDFYDRVPRWLWDIVWELWRRHLCPHGHHLWDECESNGEHTLFCDACELDVHIARIDDSMVARG